MNVQPIRPELDAKLVELLRIWSAFRQHHGRPPGSVFEALDWAAGHAA